MSYGYIYEEETQLPAWKLEDSVTTILGYACKSATTNFRGRKWNVYYTPEIPLNRGPWKLWGLPGLIVYAEDEAKNFKYILTGFEKVQYQVPILSETVRFSSNKIKKLPKEEVKKIEKLYHNNIYDFMDLLSGKTRKLSSNNNNRKLSIPYIPLEKE